MTNPPTPDPLGGKSPSWHRCMAAFAEDEAMRLGGKTREQADCDAIRHEQINQRRRDDLIDFTETGMGRECIRGMLRAANEEEA